MTSSLHATKCKTLKLIYQLLSGNKVSRTSIYTTREHDWQNPITHVPAVYSTVSQRKVESEEKGTFPSRGGNGQDKMSKKKT